ncbi:phosphate acetyltransferase [Psychrobacter lutiphocae]|uniref:phosphate acetyltransferase n=1 Tax=Psychrobacter lutiphocae TaxID=540500 RepID=UPI00035FF3DC|nr:phosphate acetyltransferase [Psychrobacter lutiphocae]
MQTILLVPTGRSVGLTSAALGLIKALDSIGIQANFSKPFLQDDSHDAQQTLDSSSELAKQVFGLNPPDSIPRDRLERMMNSGNTDDLMEEVVSNIQNAVADTNSLVICEGLVPTEEANYASQMNYALAIALDAKVIFVSVADLDNPKQLAEKIDGYARIFGGLSSERTLGSILMRAKNITADPDAHHISPGEAKVTLDSSFIQAMQSHSPKFATDAFHVIGVIPFSNSLSVPRTWDIGQGLHANWLNEGAAKKRRVLNTSLTARTISRVGEVFSKGTLIVTPGDRDDLLLASAMAAVNNIEMAGIVLTGDIVPNDTVFELCQPALKAGLPIMSVATNSFETVTNLTNLSNEIPKDDIERAEAVTGFVAAHLDVDWLKNYVGRDYKPRLSPSAFRNQVVRKAQGAKMRVVLPEGEEPRTIEAATICQKRGIAKCVLLGNADKIAEVAKDRGVTLPEDIEIIDPSQLNLDKYIKAFVERRKGKATEEQAAKELEDTVVLGTTMLYLDEVDGLVSGAIHTTANTVRPAFQLIKTAPQYSLVSSIFFMLLPEQVVVYGDCAINPDPNAEQLAEIAIQSAASAKAFGIEPKVAMISYSTGASGTGDDVEKVKQATQVVRERAPDLLVDGPLQYDAASVLSVGKQKAPDSPVAGQANVFIFPDLNTGNTTYKAVQRSANVVSVGPMLQGLNKPVNDLSRGALVDDIVYTIALTAIQASSSDV